MKTYILFLILIAKGIKKTCVFVRGLFYFLFSDLSTLQVEYPTDLEYQDYLYNNYGKVLYNTDKQYESNQYLLSPVIYFDDNQRRSIFPFNYGLNLPQERYFWSQIRGRKPYNSLFSGKDSYLMGLVYSLLLLELPCLDP